MTGAEHKLNLPPPDTKVRLITYPGFRMVRLETLDRSWTATFASTLAAEDWRDRFGWHYAGPAERGE